MLPSTIPSLPITGPTFSQNGRQGAFNESSLQRCARMEFLHRPEAASSSRVEEWIKHQSLSSLPALYHSTSDSDSSDDEPLPSPPPVVRFKMPEHPASSRRKQQRKSLPPKDFTFSPRPVLYAIPEDAEEQQQPQVYEEPYILYSTPSPLPLKSQILSPPLPSSPSPTKRAFAHRRRLSSESDLRSIPEE